MDIEVNIESKNKVESEFPDSAFVVIAASSSWEHDNAKETKISEDCPLNSRKRLLEPIYEEWDCVWNYVTKLYSVNEKTYLISDANKVKRYERWASSSNFPIQNIINNGSTIKENRFEPLGNLNLMRKLKTFGNRRLVVVVPDDMLSLQNLDLALNKIKEKGEENLVFWCPESEKTNFQWNFNPISKKKEMISERAFYCMNGRTLSLISEFQANKESSISEFVFWCIHTKQIPFFEMVIPSALSIEADRELLNCAPISEEEFVPKPGSNVISHRVYARVGLMGNPSDGFNGKTISLSIKNFWADVTIQESSRLKLMPNVLCDPLEFGNLKDLHSISSRDGYVGGLRLLQAACKIFYQHCTQNGISLTKRNFTLAYDTNIPRQVGLAGSSAIVTGVLKCLMEFFELTDDHIPKQVQPSLVLSVERDELNIKAGLQDRVVQIYEGLVYMDFNKNHMNKYGYGDYSYIREASLPKMFLVYNNSPSDSGKIHSDVSHRYASGDKDVISGMSSLAELTERAKMAIEMKDWVTFRQLVDLNFEGRRELYGEEVLGLTNLRMIGIGKQFGAAVKFPGSGGAILGFPGKDTDVEAIADFYRSEGFMFVDIVPIGVE